MDVNKLLVRELKEDDLKSILSISALQLGPSYLNRRDLVTYSNDHHTKLPVLLYNNVVIGYSIIHLIKKSMLNLYAKADIDTFVHSLKEGDVIQLRKTTAIHPDFVGKGMGTFFIEKTMGQYSKDCRLILSINWKRKGDIPVKRISEKLGMKQRQEIIHYWAEESFEKGFDCPECGKPPCTCSAVLFFKEVN